MRKPDGYPSIKCIRSLHAKIYFLFCVSHARKLAFSQVRNEGLQENPLAHRQRLQRPPLDPEWNQNATPPGSLSTNAARCIL